MSKCIKKGASNGGSTLGVIGHIGDNCIVKDVPCLLPKENMAFFNEMQRNVKNNNSFKGCFNPADHWNG